MISTAINDIISYNDRKLNSDDRLRKEIINNQIRLVDELRKEYMIEQKTINQYREKVIQDNQTEFNIDLDKFDELEKTRDMIRGFSNLFKDEFAQLKEKLVLLKENLRKELKGELVAEEQIQLLSNIKDIVGQIMSQEQKVEDYLRILDTLKYDKRTLKSGQIIAKIIKYPFLLSLTNKLFTGEKTRFFIKILGVENVPDSGPCIIAPHHHHAALDPVLVRSAIKRPVFFIASAENFVIPIHNYFVRKSSTIPYERDDAGRIRITPKKLKEKVVEHKTKNWESIKVVLKHLVAGHAIIIFPEDDAKVFGNTYPRGRDEEFIEPKNGFVYFSVKLKQEYNVDVPIIPVGMKYEGRTVTVTFSEPVRQPANVAKLKGLQIKEYIEGESQRIFRIIQELS